MGFLSGRWDEMNRLMIEALAPYLAPGETLLGAVAANEQKTFSANLYVVGVTPDRLLLVPVDRKWHPKDPPRAITRDQITACSVWGWGDGLKTWLSMSSDQQIRIETADFSVKLLVLGGNVVENAVAGDDQVRGLEAFIGFLQSAPR